MFEVQKASLIMFWGYSPKFGEPCLWLVESKESSPEDEEEIRIKMDDGVDISLDLEGIYLFVDLWEAQHCLWDQKLYSSRITLLGMIKLYWF